VTEPLVILVSIPVVGDRLQLTPLPDVSLFATAVMATELPACTTKVLLATVIVTMMFGGVITPIEEPPPPPHPDRDNATPQPTSAAIRLTERFTMHLTGSPAETWAVEKIRKRIGREST
jgi:hypothetical protein